MSLRNNLIGLVLGTSALIGGAYGFKYSVTETIKYKEQAAHYQKVLEINEEKIKQGLREVLSPEEIVKTREIIRYYLSSRENIFWVGYPFLVLGIAGAVANIISSYNLARDLRKKIISTSSYDKPTPAKGPETNNLTEKIQEIENPELPTDFIDPWSIDIRNKEGGKTK